MVVQEDEQVKHYLQHTENNVDIKQEEVEDLMYGIEETKEAWDE